MMADQRGGARIGAGRPREYLKLDKEARGDLEQLLKLQREILGQVDLTDELVVKRLIHDARVQLEAAYAEATRQAQETLRQSWKRSQP